MSESGGSWERWRRELVKSFKDIVVIANTSSAKLQSMSADTGMSEMLVVATKREKDSDGLKPTEILCVNLNAAPSTMAEGYALSREIAAIPRGRATGIADWGNWARIKQYEPDLPWGAVGNSNVDLVAVSRMLLDGIVYDPSRLVSTAMSLQMCDIGDVAGTGPTHHTISDAFDWELSANLQSTPAQLSMWAADSKTRKTIAAHTTHGGTVVDQTVAKRLVNRRSKWFITRTLRWTSQATAFAHTRSDTHGGRAWNALQDLDDEVGRCLAFTEQQRIWRDRAKRVWSDDASWSCNDSGECHCGVAVSGFWSGCRGWRTC